MSMVRAQLFARLAQDLVGPGSDAELLTSRPSDCYLTGILFPRRTQVAEEENEELGGGVNEDGAGEQTGGDAAPEAVALSNTQRQSSAGISFAVAADSGNPVVEFEVRCGVYGRRWVDP